MAKIRRGRLSNADRQRIHDMYGSGKSIAQISKEVERREDIIAGILGLSKRALAAASKVAPPAKKDGRPAKEAPAVAAAVSVAVASASEDDVLEHHFWVRPGYPIGLRLPADLTASEAERLASMIKSLPFS